MRQVLGFIATFGLLVILSAVALWIFGDVMGADLSPAVQTIIGGTIGICLIPAMFRLMDL